MRVNEIITKPQTIAEDASAGASASGGIATSMGGGAGFGKSIWMRRAEAKPQKKKSKR